MKIQNNYYNYYQPQTNKSNFKAFNRQVTRTAKVAKNFELNPCNDTTTYRGGEIWKQICDILVDKYKNIEKVNTYVYACSIGAEPCTFLMQLLSNYPKQIVEKFLPIIAKDYDKDVIQLAKKAELPINIKEQDYVNKFTNGRFNEFFGCATKKIDNPQNVFYDDWLYPIKPVLSENIKYSTADIRKDYKNIKPENSVVFLRNFWLYLFPEDRVNLAKNLYEHLGNNSTVIIGDFDLIHPYFPYDIGQILVDAGFNPTRHEMIYQVRK